MFKQDPLIIVPYRTYGTNHHLYVMGRALQEEKLKITENQSLFKTIKNTYKQFKSDEVMFATIKLSISKELPDFSFKADSEGYIKVDDTLDPDLSAMADEKGWVQYNLSYDGDFQNQKISDGNRFSGEFIIPPATAEFGVISDIDDTILHTGVTSFLKWRVLHNSLMKNVYDRIPLEGAANFYQKLGKGTNNSENPIFYLSNSPWNLYQYLKLFLDSNQFPKGPILLRNFRSPFFDRSAKPEKPHKQKEIINIIKTYPALKFILIGDSGEHDPSIYTEIAAQFPDRISAIYLRSVRHRKKMEKVKAIVDNYTTTPLVMVKTSEEAEAHARKHGFIK